VQTRTYLEDEACTSYVQVVLSLEAMFAIRDARHVQSKCREMLHVVLRRFPLVNDMIHCLAKLEYVPDTELMKLLWDILKP
jgi:hypothetical protein